MHYDCALGSSGAILGSSAVGLKALGVEADIALGAPVLGSAFTQPEIVIVVEIVVELLPHRIFSGGMSGPVVLPIPPDVIRSSSLDNQLHSRSGPVHAVYLQITKFS